MWVCGAGEVGVGVREVEVVVGDSRRNVSEWKILQSGIFTALWLDSTEGEDAVET